MTNADPLPPTVLGRKAVVYVRQSTRDAGLLLPGERKSVEPMAARLHAARVQAAHQSLHHFVAKAKWSDEAGLTGYAATSCPSSSAAVRSAP